MNKTDLLTKINFRYFKIKIWIESTFANRLNSFIGYKITLVGFGTLNLRTERHYADEYYVHKLIGCLAISGFYWVRIYFFAVTYYTADVQSTRMTSYIVVPLSPPIPSRR